MDHGAERSLALSAPDTVSCSARSGPRWCDRCGMAAGRAAPTGACASPSGGPMIASTRPAQAYTDAPALHPNLLLGSLQLFGWLFFRPTAWCNHIIRIAPTLHPNFCLAVLTPTQWRDRQVQRLFVQCYVV